MANVGKRMFGDKPGVLKVCGQQDGVIRCLPMPDYQPGEFYGLTSASDGVNYPTVELAQINGQFVMEGDSPWQLDFGQTTYFDFTPYPDNRSPNPYDCINGECVRAATFRTVGQYPDLEACQAACGGSGCEGECVSAADMAAHRAAVDRVRTTFCP